MSLEKNHKPPTSSTIKPVTVVCFSKLMLNNTKIYCCILMPTLLVLTCLLFSYQSTAHEGWWSTIQWRNVQLRSLQTLNFLCKSYWWGAGGSQRVRHKGVPASHCYLHAAQPQCLCEAIVWYCHAMTLKKQHRKMRLNQWSHHQRSHLCFFTDVPSESHSVVCDFLHVSNGAEALLVVSCKSMQDHWSVSGKHFHKPEFWGLISMVAHSYSCYYSTTYLILWHTMCYLGINDHIVYISFYFSPSLRVLFYTMHCFMMLVDGTIK